jgi:hypothetical protein
VGEEALVSQLDDQVTKTGPEGRLSGARWAPTVFWLFVVTTVANYIWQIPYYVHFYAVHGRWPAPLAVMFLVTFAWFAAAAFVFYHRRRGGWASMVAFVAVLVGFYVLHNISGAFVVDLSLSDPILFIASVLGYLNTLTGIVFLVHLIRRRHDEAPASRDTPSAAVGREGASSDAH